MSARARKRKQREEEAAAQDASASVSASESEEESDEVDSAEELDSAEVALEQQLQLHNEADDDDDDGGEDVNDSGSDDEAGALRAFLGDGEEIASDAEYEPSEARRRARQQRRQAKRDRLDPRIQYLVASAPPADNKRAYAADADFYESESDDEELDGDANTVGRVPMEWYRHYDHIGYNIFGQRLLKSEEADRLDRFLSRTDDPAYWRTVRDELNAKDVTLSERELDMIRAMQRNRFPTAFDPYEVRPEIDDPHYKVHPLNNAPEPKSRFVPSKWERLKVRKLVLAIRRGQIKKEPEEEDEDQLPKYYDLWRDTRGRHAPFMQVKATKPALPTHAESYRPPEEYLFDDDELKEWEETDEEDRAISHVPQRLDRLREIPLFAQGLKERFERCLDLYLCPRTIKRKMNVDPKKLVPKLPKPQDLRPFPSVLSLTFEGHEDRVRAVTCHPSGQWIASSSDDGTVRVWEVMTGRCVNVFRFSDDDDIIVADVAWCPNVDVALLSVAVGEFLYLVHAGVGTRNMQSTTQMLLTIYEKVKANSDAPVEWKAPSEEQSVSSAAVVSIEHPRTIKQVVWHHKGDYLATVSPTAGPKSVLIHQISAARSQAPFSKKSRGQVETVSFHPTKPFFIVASQRQIRVYNLVRQKLFKKLVPNCKWVSGVDVHPGGDNLIVSSYDRRLCWFDLDLSTKPYKTLRYHSQAIRRAKFSKKYPLFASSSDDGTVHVFHGMVYDDLAKNALIVPLKVLKGHEVSEDGLGVLDIEWHPTNAWIFSAGADHTIRLWT